jgi:hypothetical protein
MHNVCGVGETFLPSDWIVEQAWADKGPQSLQYPAAHAVPRLSLLGFKENSRDTVCVRYLIVAQGVHWVPDVTRAAEEMAITERPLPDSLRVKLLCRTTAQVEH